tara:strand:+ start:163 stop:339 length:177 start_codon:yes stop_codon:yes gene_type:complete
MPGVSVSEDCTVMKSMPDVMGLKFWTSVPMILAYNGFNPRPEPRIAAQIKKYEMGLRL